MSDLFMAVMKTSPDATVVDLGVTPDRSLAESNFFENAYLYKSASPPPASRMRRFSKFPGLKFVQIQAGRLPFSDNQFDIVYSSAVIEHVGVDRRMGAPTAIRFQEDAGAGLTPTATVSQF